LPTATMTAPSTITHDWTKSSGKPVAES
jgi:hypothetical protein